MVSESKIVETFHNSLIIDAVRSPIGVKGGKMAGMRADTLMAQVISGLLTRNENLPLEVIDEIILGCAFPEASQGSLLARSAAILAGVPATSGAKVVSRLCGSSMDALHQADAAIRLGDQQAVIVCGVEDMFSIPPGGFNPSYHPELAKKNFYLTMGEAAENLAREAKIEREVQEEYAMSSHRKALEAWGHSRFNNEVIPVQHETHIIARDEGPHEPDEDRIIALPPLFGKDSTITEATGSPAAVGGTAILMTSEEVAQEYGLKPRARLISRAVAGVNWERPETGALAAAEKALQKAGLTIDDIKAIELNESFAAQVLYVILKAGWPFRKINLNGGAIALGNPLGCSGARVVTTLINILEQRNARYGLAAMCISSGQGIATVIERENGEA
jgi:acetyl-CoA acetyltransferase family protein